MFLVAFFVLALLSVPLLGGRPGRLADLRVERAWVAGLALALQILIVSVIPGASRLGLTIVHVASYVLAGYFLWINRRIAGLPIVGLGWALNALVIGANGGVMPAGPAVAEAGARGAEVASAQFLNSRPLAAPRLGFLGDNFSLPQSWPFHNVFSVGDVLIAVGAFVVLHWACGSLVSDSFSRRRRVDAAGASGT